MIFIPKHCIANRKITLCLLNKSVRVWLTLFLVVVKRETLLLSEAKEVFKGNNW